MSHSVASGNEDYLFHFCCQENVDRYVWAAQYVAYKSVLDVACGQGFGSKLLIEAGASQVIGGDISRTSILFAEENYKKRNLSFVQLDACNLPFCSDYFDVVVTLETIEHLPEYKRFLSECRRVLKSGGLLIISTPNKTVFSEEIARREAAASASHNLGHVKEFEPDEFRDLLQEHFSEVSLYGHRSSNVAEIIKRKLTNKIAQCGKALLHVTPLPKGLKLRIKNFAVCFLTRPISLENLKNTSVPKFAILPFNESLNQANLIALATKQIKGKS